MLMTVSWIFSIFTQFYILTFTLQFNKHVNKFSFSAIEMPMLFTTVYLLQNGVNVDLIVLINRTGSERHIKMSFVQQCFGFYH